MRIGSGHDVHRLVEGRRLVVGGVEIPFGKGLDGHSDADVLVHAACDALLGAAALGDIGMHFPDTDGRFLHIDSLVLLEKTGTLLEKEGFEIINIDGTVFAQAPKMSPYRQEMTGNIARVLMIRPGQVSVKFTTTEGLGFVGSGAGMAAHCMALINRKII